MAFDETPVYLSDIAALDDGTPNMMGSFYVQRAAFASRPAQGNKGVFFISSDGVAGGGTDEYLFWDDGSSWISLGVIVDAGAQTWAGVKTFSSIPVLPASNPTTGNQATRKTYVDNEITSAIGGSSGTVVAVNDDLIQSADTARTETSASYVKKKEITIEKAGVYRIKFDLELTTGVAAAYGRIYRNGSAVGTERSLGSGPGFTTFSEDLSGWSDNDLCQLYSKSDSGDTATVRNFRIYGRIEPEAGTVNTD